MATVTAFEAKTRFGEILNRVANGEEIVITRHDHPVARMVPEGRNSLEQARRAVAQIRAVRQKIARRLGAKVITDKEIREAIEEGRR